jgi:hypothetical protein
LRKWMSRVLAKAKRKAILGNNYTFIEMHMPRSIAQDT